MHTPDSITQTFDSYEMLNDQLDTFAKEKGLIRKHDYIDQAFAGYFNYTKWLGCGETETESITYNLAEFAAWLNQKEI